LGYFKQFWQKEGIPNWYDCRFALGARFDPVSVHCIFTWPWCIYLQEDTRTAIRQTDARQYIT
jgi:hypothetical protein